MENNSQKVAIVTGGSRGIGKATALAFARKGINVVIADVLDREGTSLARDIEQMSVTGKYVHTDVSNSVQVQAMVEQALQLYGHIDYAFNNAGITQPPVPSTEQTEETFNKLVNINFKGVWLCLKYILPPMLQQGKGAIVNMSSFVGVVSHPAASLYSATKHAVWGLTQSTALEFAKKGIRVNAVGPGTIDTPMIQDFINMNNGDPTVMDAINAAHPIGRQGKPEEVANAVVWLCSDEASFITGHMMLIDGGITAA